MSRALATAMVTVFALSIWGCGKEPPRPTDSADGTAMPFVRIPTGDEDPATSGPDDSTVLDAMPGGYGQVRFSHFTHSSNKERGYGVPCRECHHTFRPGEDITEGCVRCHHVPDSDDPAHDGPDDVMVLRTHWREPDMIGPVPFNHFTHASSKGYRIGCEQCHHTGDNVACTECHGRLARVDDDGAIVPKAKRAYHLMCGRCHDAIKAQDPKTVAPTDCNSCHTDRGPRRLAGHLTLDRALHIMCIRCHEGVKRAHPAANAPTRVCADCHDGGYTGTPRQMTPTRPPPKLEKPAAAEAADAGPGDEPTPPAAPAGDAAKGPETLTIKLGEGGKPAREFTHAAHVGYAESCIQCHHEGLGDPTCSGCHKPADSRRIYHKLCIDCHKAKGAPATCKDCHP